MARASKPEPKKIVYLWGAGATHAEAQYLGASINLLMQDNEHFGDGITTRILRRMSGEISSSFGPGQKVDIEKLISLLAASGVEAHSRWADEIRAKYFTELKMSLAAANVIENPRLAIRLLQLHNNRDFKAGVEQLSGIITTNHDGLLQIASQIVFGKVNLGFKFDSKDYITVLSNSVPPIIQLHGSFTWEFGEL